MQRGLSFYHLVTRNQLIRLQSGDTLVYVLMWGEAQLLPQEWDFQELKKPKARKAKIHQICQECKKSYANTTELATWVKQRFPGCNILIDLRLLIISLHPSMVQLKKETEKNSHFVKQIEGSDWCALLQIERTRNIPCLGFPLLINPPTQWWILIKSHLLDERLHN